MAELVVVLALFGIIGRIGIVSFREFQESFRKNEARYQFDSDLRRIRNQAVALGGRTILKISADGLSYSTGTDLLPYSATAAFDTQSLSRKLPSGIKLSSSQVIVFDSRGYLIDVSGNYTNASVTFIADGSTFFSGTLYTTGALS